MVRTRSIENLNKVIIIGTSAGGIHALKSLLSGLKMKFPCPIVIVIHRLKNVKSHLVEVLQNFTKLKVCEAEEKQELQSGYIYVAPANYHLLLEDNFSFSLCVDEVINFSRPSIDVSFVSFAQIIQNNLLAIVLTGANADGANGLATVCEFDGEVWVQNPEEAYVASMPKEALKKVPNAKTMTIQQMSTKLKEFYV